LNAQHDGLDNSSLRSVTLVPSATRQVDNNTVQSRTYLMLQRDKDASLFSWDLISSTACCNALQRPQCRHFATTKFPFNPISVKHFPFHFRLQATPHPCPLLGDSHGKMGMLDSHGKMGILTSLIFSAG